MKIAEKWLSANQQTAIFQQFITMNDRFLQDLMDPAFRCFDLAMLHAC